MQDYTNYDPNPVLVPAPPHSDDAERSVIGSLLQDPECVFKAVDALVPEDFYSPAAQSVYQAIFGLNADAVPVDLMTVSEALRKSGSLESVGGLSYLLECVRFVPSTANVQSYIDIVAEKSTLRKLIKAANDIRNRCYAETEDVESIVASASSDIETAVSKDANANDAPKPLKDLMGKVFDTLDENSKRQGAINGIPSGFYDLDRMLTGFHPGEMIIAAGRPAMGKTSLALDIAHFASAKQKKSVLLFSLEMPAEQIAMRLLSFDSHVPMQSMRNGTLSVDEWTVIGDSITSLAESTLLIDDDSSQTPSKIRRKLKRMKDKGKLPDLVLIDYLGLIESDRRSENRQTEVSAISRKLKAMAREFELPIIVLSQLSRANANRADKRPALTDLRESGSIEQDADVVLFVHREGYYDPDKDQTEGQIIVAKQRNGPVGDVEVKWDAEVASYRNPPGTLVAKYM